MRLRALVELGATSEEGSQEEKETPKARSVGATGLVMTRENSALIEAENVRDYITTIETNGFAIVEDVIDAGTVDKLLAELGDLKADVASTRRAGKAFGIRNLLNVLPSARVLANSAPLRSFIEPVLGSEARVVRGIYFDKFREANWKVAWHQDLTIAVRQQARVECYGPWSMKAGITHVQAPISILENILAVRLHLDDADERNGALRVIPGSHKHGRIDADDIPSWKEQHISAICPVKRGGVMVMRPLLLHASSAASHPEHRRVMHFEYSSSPLSGGLMWYEE